MQPRILGHLRMEAEPDVRTLRDCDSIIAKAGENLGGRSGAARCAGPG